MPFINDIDKDGLDDAWEIFYFGNPYRYNGENDTDADGLSNEQEELWGTNPSNPDTDGDWLPDGLETKFTCQFHLNPLNYDSNGNGLDDMVELYKCFKSPTPDHLHRCIINPEEFRQYEDSKKFTRVEFTPPEFAGCDK